MPDERPTIHVALAGNPNCGKTTLFNGLTGSRQRVGNWPGVTVEYIEGTYRQDDADVRVIDLPGIYSFSAHTLDETIARDYILKQKPDVVVNIVDATNLERNLYLTTQLIEMKAPVVVALNMMDLIKRRGIAIEVEHLERHLGCPVVPVVASRKEGLDALRKAVARMAAQPAVSTTRVAYDSEVEEAVVPLTARAAGHAAQAGVDPRWLAIKLLESDETAVEMTRGEMAATVRGEVRRIERHTGDAMDIVMADGRYGFIHGLARDVVQRREEMRRTVSDAIDRVVLNRLLGVPIFLGVMALMFFATINVGGPFIDFFDKLMGTVAVDGVRAALQSVNAPGVVITLLADGVGGGIQTVATLIPPIFFIFLCLSILEDSGYMARAAFTMDHLLRRIGLPGKAFLPLVVGFGCNVPGILATRTLENPRDRLMTVLINPFMSCGARFPVYALFAVAFFPRYGTAAIFSLYFAGIALAMATAFMFKRTILRGEASAFVMELPPYHVPTWGGIMHHTWHRLRGFIVRAGKIIVLFVIALRLLSSVGTDGSFGKAGGDSVLGAIGKSMTPAFRPMGVSDRNWPAVVGLFSGVFAKEAVVGTLDALYSQLESDGQEAGADDAPFRFWRGVGEAFMAIPEGFSSRTAADAETTALPPADSGDNDAVARTVESEVHVETFGAMRTFFGSRAAAFAYMLFVLIYVPCVAAMGAIYREAGLKWTLFAVGYLTGLAWVVATAFYQLATMGHHPATSAAWLALCAGLVVAFYIGLKIKSGRLKEAHAS